MFRHLFLNWPGIPVGKELAYQPEIQGSNLYSVVLFRVSCHFFIGTVWCANLLRAGIYNFKKFVAVIRGVISDLPKWNKEFLRETGFSFQFLTIKDTEMTQICRRLDADRADARHKGDACLTQGRRRKIIFYRIYLVSNLCQPCVFGSQNTVVTQWWHKGPDARFTQLLHNLVLLGHIYFFFTLREN